MPTRSASTLALFLTALLSLEAIASPVDEARLALEGGDLRQATILLKDRLQQDPTDVAARLLLARVHLATGDGAGAEKELQRAEDSGADPQVLVAPMAEALLLLGRPREALAELARMPPDRADAAHVLTLNGRARLALGEPDAARAAFEAAVSREPGRVEAARGLLFLDNAADPAGATARTEGFLERFPNDAQALLARAHLHIKAGEPGPAAEHFTRAIALAPWSVPALGGRAVAHIALDQAEMAEADLAAIEALDPAAALPSYLRAVMALQAGDLALARRHLEAALAANPEHPQSRYLRGVVALQQRELETAVEHLGAVLRGFPRHLNAAKALAAAHLALGEPDNAARALERFAHEDQGDAELLRLLGTALLRSGQTAEGVRRLEQAVAAAPDARGIRPGVALSLLDAGEAGAAAALLEVELALGPEGSEVETLLALTQIRSGAIEAAGETAAGLTRRLPENPIGHNLQGLVRLAGGDPAAAAEHFSQALRKDPGFNTARLNLARAELADGDPAAAAAALDAALAAIPDDPEALLLHAEAARAQGDTAAEEQWLERAIAARPSAAAPAAALLRNLIDRGMAEAAARRGETLAASLPDEPALALLRAEALRRTGNRGGAIALLTQARATAPALAAVPLALGRLRLEIGDSDSARADFATALEIAPDLLAARVGLAAAARQAGDAERALELARTIQQDLPDHPTGHRMEGDVLFELGRHAEAAGPLERAYKQSPTGELARHLAESHYQSGNPERAMATLEDWIARAPGDRRARAMLSLWYQSAGRTDDALALFSTLDFGDPPDPLVMNNVAWMLFEQGDPRAMALAARAYDLLPERAEVIDTYAWILFRSGQPDQGLRLLQQARLAHPGDPHISYHLGLALSERERPQEAAAILRELIARTPNAPTAEDARALLERLR